MNFIKEGKWAKMNRVNELIKEYCPDGVEIRCLEDCCNLLDKKRKPITKAAREAGEYPYYGANGIQDYVANYIFDGTFVLVGEDGSVITKSGTPVVTWAEGKIWVNNHAHIIEEKDGVMLRYLYHYLQTIDVTSLIHGNIPKLTGGDFKALKIAVPPLEVQREIVHVLDSFTLLTAELTAELTVRKKQYEFYRNKLLSHDGKYPMKPLADLGKWSGGKTPSMSEKNFWEQGTIPWISSKDMKASTLIDTKDHITEKAVTEASMTVYPANSVAIVTRSGILKHTFPVAYVPFETTINQDIKMLVVNEDILPRYAFHVIQGKGKDILIKTKKQGGTVDSLDFQKVLAYKVPVPSKDIQSRLVEVLDNFESICTDLNIGLPAEIEARKKQYKYYRDLLLTFAETGSTLMTDRQTDRQTELSAIKLIQYVFGYAMLPLKKIATVFRGEYITKKSTKSGTIPVILGGQEPAYYIDKHNHDGEIVVVARSGASAGFVSYWNQKIFVTDGFGYEEKSELITTKFLYYVLKNVESELNAMKRGAGVPHVSGETLNNIELPIPSLQEQNRITDILERFDSLCNDLSAGLPAEIEVRQKQYEYYRDKLLSFKELPK